MMDFSVNVNIFKSLNLVLPCLDILKTAILGNPRKDTLQRLVFIL